MSHYTRECLFCGTQAIEEPPTGDRLELKCPICGHYRTSGSDASVIQHDPDRKLLQPYLAAHIRQANARGERPVLITAEHWRERAEAHRHISVPEKLTKLLGLLEVRSEGRAGVRIDQLSGKDAPLCDAYDEDELHYLLGTLNEQREIAWLASNSAWVITAGGWTKLRPTGGVPGSCFVAMAFDTRLDAAFEEGIEPAIRNDCGFSAVRVDRVHHNESINDRIIIGLRTSQFVVADVTFQRNGVYFEGGFAMALGRPVIWTVREDDRKNVHFDTSHLNHIVWKDPADLRRKLALRIQATIPGAKLS